MTKLDENVGSNMANEIVKISVLIITRNRSFILGDCLKALHPQSESTKHEVVVVDSSEADDTEKLIKNFPWVKYHRISLPLGTRPQSYSYGAKLCQGEIVVLLDDDAIVLPGWLKVLEACFEDPGVGITGGRVLPKEGVSLPEVKGDEPIGVITAHGRIVSNLFIDSGEPIEVDVTRGCNMAIRKSLLEQVNYFDLRLRGQNCRVEDDICLGVKRLGYKVIFEPRAVVRHLAEERPDIPRSEYNVRSEFYVWRNTVWLYAKHFGFKPKIILFVSFITPFRECVRRVVGGSFKRPKVTQDGLKYLPAALAGIGGGVWGLFMSFLYRVQDQFSQSSLRRPFLQTGQLAPSIQKVGRSRMNILLIDRALPSSVFSGKTVRLKNVYGRLAKTENIIYARTTQEGEETESQELESWAHETFHACLRLRRLKSPKFQEKLSTALQLKPWYDLFAKYGSQLNLIQKNLSDIVERYQIGLVITFDQEVAQYGLLLSEKLPWIQDLGDSMTMQTRRQLKHAENWKRRFNLSLRLLRESRFEHEMISKAKGNIFVAEDDTSVHRNGKNISVEVIPNGVDTDYFNPEKVEALETVNPYVVFTGHMSFKPNESAVLYFARKIFPLVRKEIPDLEFKIVGADPTERVKGLESIAGIEVTGRVPDVRPYLKGARAFVCSMTMGSGIKNKLLEAISMEIPVVTSSLGLKGITNLPEGLVKLADSPENFSKQLVEILKDSPSASSYLRVGREFIIQNYSWDGTLKRYRSLFKKIFSEKVIR